MGRLFAIIKKNVIFNANYLYFNTHNIIIFLFSALNKIYSLLFIEYTKHSIFNDLIPLNSPFFEFHLGKKKGKEISNLDVIMNITCVMIIKIQVILFFKIINKKLIKTKKI